MNPLDTSLDAVPPDHLIEHMRRVKEFIRTTSDPNTASPDGQSCLLFALAFCAEGDGEDLVQSLLDRGADPNRPSALAVFQIFMTAANRVEALDRLIRAGLKLNEVHAVEAGSLPTGRGGAVTLLDYAMDVNAYLGLRKAQAAQKRAGPLRGRRRFVTDVIAMLKAHGAVRAVTPG
jgi:hypothetical protein